ncbi:hypothetical protein [Sulfurospirillum sp. MES]|uniref:hypothetical protein n=1 Tax=Sulfurospirillum sp. MES TaxID=1565314 RepID=UPI000542341C|nr:hypothetical protein [Sulfurospirillum sp. MES]KHG32923.1 MAG: hypothetical protein OA34_12730 [Sulfurospirillum sp. MES]
MKTIFAKYNSERLPQYQIVTKLVQDENENKYAIKQALTKEAQKHIDQIFLNYELLASKYTINLVQPRKTSNGILFEMAQGKSLENILLECIEKSDKESFEKYVNKFIDFVDSFVTKRNVIFEPCENFKSIFGEWESNEPQDIIEIANIDMIFGNIFVDNAIFTLIDYEWVFNFPIPKSYVVWRSLAIFSAYHSIEMNKFIEINNEDFMKLDSHFSNFVHGKNKKYFLASKVAKVPHFINLEHKEAVPSFDYVIQLFIDQGDGFVEENSIRLPVAQNPENQKFTFDLTDKQTIKTLRLDPLSECCVIEIESLYVRKNATVIDLLPYVHSNAEIHHGKSLFFTTNDPQMYFSGLDESTFEGAQSLVVVLRYMYIAKDALHVCVKQKNRELLDKEHNIQSLNRELLDKEHNIQSLNRELLDKEHNIQSLNRELLDMYTSKSWKITRPLRHFKRIIKG